MSDQTDCPFCGTDPEYFCAAHVADDAQLVSDFLRDWHVQLSSKVEADLVLLIAETREEERGRASAEQPQPQRREWKHEPYDVDQSDASRAVTYLKDIGMPGKSGELLQCAAHLCDSVLAPIRTYERGQRSASPQLQTFCDACAVLRCASTEDALCRKRKAAGGKHSWHAAGSGSATEWAGIAGTHAGTIVLLEAVAIAAEAHDRYDQPSSRAVLQHAIMAWKASPCAGPTQTSGGGSAGPRFPHAVTCNTAPASAFGDAGILSPKLAERGRDITPDSVVTVKSAPNASPTCDHGWATSDTADRAICPTCNGGGCQPVPSRAEPSSCAASDDERVAVVLAPGGMQERRVRRMLADVRRETIAWCVDWVDHEEGHGCADALAVAAKRRFTSPSPMAKP